jgi:Dienelactone hydrolase family
VELETEWVDYDSPAGSVSAYLARPQAAGGPLPGLLVLQEIWGVDRHIVDLVERFATAGYVTLAPDLFSMGGGRPPALQAGRVERTKEFLNTIPPADWTAVLGDDQQRAEALGRLPGDEGQRVGETLGVLFGQMRGQIETFVELSCAASTARTILGSWKDCRRSPSRCRRPASTMSSGSTPTHRTRSSTTRGRVTGPRPPAMPGPGRWPASPKRSIR